MKTLEKILNFGKKALAVVSTIAMTYVPVNASQLSNFLDAEGTGTQNSSAEITHHSMPFLFDANFNYGNTPAVDIFYGEDLDRKKGIGELADNMDTQVANIGGRGLTAPKFCELSANISETEGIPENNMTDKKVIQKLYDTNDTATTDDDTLLGTYDAWNMTESGQRIGLTVRNGISHRLETSFNYNNIADFDNDGAVNMSDFAMLAKDWKKPEGNYLTDISGPEGKSDGVVDTYDLQEFAENYLQ